MNGERVVVGVGVAPYFARTSEPEGLVEDGTNDHLDCTVEAFKQ